MPQQLAFQELKTRLMSGPILAHFNPHVPIEIQNDASTVSLGAVLIYKGEDSDQILAYASRTINRAERNDGATHLELLAVVFGIKKFEHYVAVNQPFKVVTDCTAIAPL